MHGLQRLYNDANSRPGVGDESYPESLNPDLRLWVERRQITVGATCRYNVRLKFNDPGDLGHDHSYTTLPGIFG